MKRVGVRVGGWLEGRSGVVPSVSHRSVLCPFAATILSQSLSLLLSFAA